MMQGALQISILRITSQNAGSEVSIRVVLENGEHREQKSLVLTMEQYCEIKPMKGRIEEETYDLLCEARSPESSRNGALAARSRQRRRRGFAIWD